MQSPPPPGENPPQSALSAGFTLIEISIVLVIIGLVVGAVLVGRDLVRAAYTRATISEIQKFQTAVNTFYGKYGYLPGDIPSQIATQFGLTVNNSYVSGCAGNGLIDDTYCHSPTPYMINGEAGAFWVNLSSDTGLIPGTYVASGPSTGGVVLGTTIPVLPVGGGVAVQQDGAGRNWFGTGVIAQTGVPYSFVNPGMTPTDAYNMDAKIDDGMPNSGRVQASVNMLYGAGDVGAPVNAGDTSCASDGTNANTPAATYVITGSYSTQLECNLRFMMQ